LSKRKLLAFILYLCVGLTSAVSSIVLSQNAGQDWTAWIASIIDERPVVLGISSDGLVVSQVSPPMPEDGGRTGIRGLSRSGHYLAYSVYDSETFQLLTIAVYDTENEQVVVSYPISDPNTWDNGSATFNEEETHFAFSYNLYDPEMGNSPDGWRLLVFDLDTAELTHELTPAAEDNESENRPTCRGCTPLIRRFASDEVIFHLTNREIEDFARPYLWDLRGNIFSPAPAYNYFWFDIFPPTNEVAYARYDERFLPADQHIVSEHGIEYFYAPNSLWVSTTPQDEGIPIYADSEFWTMKPIFIQNGERLLFEGYPREGEYSDYRFMVIERDGIQVGEYPPQGMYARDDRFVGTPDGFVQFQAETSTLWHVNTRQQPFETTEVWSAGIWGTLLHVQYDVQPGQWDDWQDITPSED
jgi:hypothetical protein